MTSKRPERVSTVTENDIKTGYAYLSPAVMSHLCRRLTEAGNADIG